MNPLFDEARRLFEDSRRPGSGEIIDASELAAARDGARLAFAGTIVDRFEGVPPTRLCEYEIASDTLRVWTDGLGSDRLPRYAPDADRLAFLSDRTREGDFQLYFLDRGTGEAVAAPRVDGWIETFHWSPDGRRILLCVAGHGADLSSGQGAVTSRREDGEADWMPHVETANDAFRRRSVWILDVGADALARLDLAGLNIWEATWCGDHSVAAVVSEGATEGHWYDAELALFTLDGAELARHRPGDQLGGLAASPSGDRLAFIAAACSDRGFVAGELWVLEPGGTAPHPVDTNAVDVSFIEWLSDRELLLAGHRGLESVVADLDIRTGLVGERWASCDISTGGRFIVVAGTGDGDCFLIGEGFARAPELARIAQGEYRMLRSFDPGIAGPLSTLFSVRSLAWRAPDGLEIQGWLLQPRGAGPHPVVMAIHGGPIFHWRATWLARYGSVALMLLARGVALFYPNPRGSSGRGQAFSRAVIGDLAGAETFDLLSGLDHLEAEGLIDPTAIGVTGGSHGGFMTYWLVAHDARFAAAVAVAPVANQMTQHLISNIPQYVARFLGGDDWTDLAGKYVSRSPVMYARACRTPMLSICGALDRCTPPEEARQFHAALLEQGVETVLVTYPGEGHGVRRFPAVIDYVARTVGWFEAHLSTRRPGAPSSEPPGHAR